MTEISGNINYKKLLETISSVYSGGQKKAMQAINANLLDTYWHIGQHIVEFEQEGIDRAKYGAQLITKLSKDLCGLHGKGFSLSNLKRMRQFYLGYPNSATVSHQLGWSYYVELLKLDDPLERSFYHQQGINERWSIRELKRQISSSLFLRLAASKDKESIIQLAKHGQVVTDSNNVVRDPYVLDFLKNAFQENIQIVTG